MSLNAFEYKHLGEINRGIRTLTRSVQAQGNAATVPVETYNQLFARYEELRAQLDVAVAHLEEWKEYGRDRAQVADMFKQNKDEWVAYAKSQRDRAEIAERELIQLRASHTAAE